MIEAVLVELPAAGLLFPGRNGRRRLVGFPEAKPALTGAVPASRIWTLHDQRLTFATGLARMHAARHIRELIFAYVRRQKFYRSDL